MKLTEKDLKLARSDYRALTAKEPEKLVEMTTRQAAEFLKVSRPFLIGLLEKDAIPFRLVGAHRRILFSDLQTYKDAIDAKRRQVLEDLTAQAQELNMGY